MHRSILSSNHCYYLEVESEVHALLYFDFTKAVWHEANIYPYLVSSKVESWLSFVYAFYKAHGSELSTLEHMIMLLWHLWGSRNDLCFNVKLLSPKQVVESSLQLLSVYQSHHLSPRQDRSLGHPPLGWSPPDGEHLKLNVDASYSSHGTRFGFVLRDHSGTTLLSGASPLSETQIAFHVELLGLWRSFDAVRHCLGSL